MTLTQPMGRTLHLVFLLVFLVLIVAGPASAAVPGAAGGPVAGAPSGSSDPAAGGGPLLGATLEWGEDTAAGFAERLGASPGVFGHDVTMPVPAADRVHIQEFVEQAGALGAHVLLTVRPPFPWNGSMRTLLLPLDRKSAALPRGIPERCLSGSLRT